MPVIIEESGMIFGPFLDEHCFYIEKSNVYNKLKNGLKIAEFLLIQPDKNRLLIIESKSSSPNPDNPDNTEAQNQFDNFIAEISEKLLNTFTLGLALCLERHVDNKNEISKCFKEITHNSVKIILMLVINNHEDKWLVQLTTALQKKLRCISKIWPLEVFAINEKTAQKEYKLIQQIVI
ncbi:MAG: hypothetical protein ABH886_11055 [Candidatus Desantisbacteria bacterium]